MSGTVALVVLDDSGDAENLSHGLCSRETLTKRWEIHPKDPLSARARHSWEERLSRSTWQIRTRAEAEMKATKTHLRLRATLTAWEGVLQVFQRHFDAGVPRRFVKVPWNLGVPFLILI